MNNSSTYIKATYIESNISKSRLKTILRPTKSSLLHNCTTGLKNIMNRLDNCDMVSLCDYEHEEIIDEVFKIVAEKLNILLLVYIEHDKKIIETAIRICEGETYIFRGCDVYYITTCHEGYIKLMCDIILSGTKLDLDNLYVYYMLNEMIIDDNILFNLSEKKLNILKELLKERKISHDKVEERIKEIQSAKLRKRKAIMIIQIKTTHNYYMPQSVGYFKALENFNDNMLKLVLTQH